MPTKTPANAHARPLNNYPRGELAAMEKRGFIPAQLVARALGMTVQGVYKWLDSEKVEGEIAGGIRRYVQRRSLRAHIGDAQYKAALEGVTVEQLIKLAA